MTEKSPHKKEKLFRILISILAILAVLTAFTYMLFEIVRDTNATQRLLLEAFMDNSKEAIVTITTSPSSEEVPPQTESSPTYREAVSVDLSKDTLTIENATSYTLDERALSSHVFQKHLFDTRPMILLYHSDPKESYWNAGDRTVLASHAFRDSTNNITTVGDAVADVLTSAGIASIHITEPIVDIEKTLEEYRNLYPSIRYCLDIRRDGIYTNDGRIVKSEGRIGKAPSAQLMLAVGCDIAGGKLKWQSNLAAAYRIAEMMQQAEPTSLRAIHLRPESLGQQDEILHLTLFVGTTGNTLQEASSSARFFARYLALFILSNCGVD